MNSPDYRMTVVDLRIPFWRLVAFFVKSALAVIPAAIILALIFALIGVVIGMLWGTLGFGNLEMFMRRFTL
jgi:hypothetical protein